MALGAAAPADVAHLLREVSRFSPLVQDGLIGEVMGRWRHATGTDRFSIGRVDSGHIVLLSGVGVVVALWLLRHRLVVHVHVRARRAHEPIPSLIARAALANLIF